VSLPWRDPVRVSLAPGEVSLALRDFGFRGFGERERKLRPQLVLRAPAWKAAVDALAQALDPPPPRAARARVVLSNHFVRYAVVPWREGLAAPAEREAFMREVFQETYGSASAGWTLREDHAVAGAASLACGVDAQLIDALRETFRKARMRIAAIQPLYMSAFNRHRRAVGDRGCFLVYEHGRLCSGSFRDNQWRAVHGTRVDVGTPMDTAIEHEAVRHGLDADAPLFLCAVDQCEMPSAFARPVMVVEQREAPGCEARVQAAVA
jgi:hypothetical protein